MNPSAPVLLALLAALSLTRAAASDATVAFLGQGAVIEMRRQLSMPLVHI